ncbi:Sterol 3-beta-glucosyltransferase [Physocladia obscura]|uniref:Sterol 3-beta-glucosyltransferase n=1 Tax=Physocladia obscura TaxID=109957 RepID=A0AAD5XG09_9FUNG|nr:Sterol 3-beta-glucosyltransferase [Physocladia obscura]
MTALCVFGTTGDILPIIRFAKRHAARLGAIVVITHDNLLPLVAAAEIRGIGIPLVTDSRTRSTEQKALVDALKHLHLISPLRVIGCNLFALEAFAIAEMLRIPCFALSTFAVAADFPPPHSFMSHLPRSFFETLNLHSAWLASIKHYLWRVFLDDNGHFRQSMLNLAPFPQFDLSKPPPPLFYLIDECLLNLTTVPVILFPDSVIVSGPCHELFDRSLQNSLLLLFKQFPELQNFLDEQKMCNRKIIHIGFGSMDVLHPILANEFDAVSAIYEMFLEALLSTNTAAVWIITEDCRAAIHKLKSNSRLLILRGVISHADLFNSGIICASINHGGLGTISEVLRFGLKQIIAPFLFDQRVWAERLENIGCAKIVSDDIDSVNVGEMIFLIRWSCLPIERELATEFEKWKNSGTMFCPDKVDIALQNLLLESGDITPPEFDD